MIWRKILYSWQTHLDTNFPRAGGQCLAPSIIAVPGNHHDHTVLLDAFIVFIQHLGSATYTQGITFQAILLSDHAVIRSFDGGNTWDFAATEIGTIQLCTFS